MYSSDALAAARWARRTGRPSVFAYMGVPDRPGLTDRRLRLETTAAGGAGGHGGHGAQPGGGGRVPALARRRGARDPPGRRPGALLAGRRARGAADDLLRGGSGRSPQGRASAGRGVRPPAARRARRRGSSSRARDDPALARPARAGAAGHRAVRHRRRDAAARATGRRGWPCCPRSARPSGSSSSRRWRAAPRSWGPTTGRSRRSSTARRWAACSRATTSTASPRAARGAGAGGRPRHRGGVQARAADFTTERSTRAYEELYARAHRWSLSRARRREPGLAVQPRPGRAAPRAPGRSAPGGRARRAIAAPVERPRRHVGAGEGARPGPPAAPQHPGVGAEHPALALLRAPRLRDGGALGVAHAGARLVARGPSGARQPPPEVEVLGIHPLRRVEAAGGVPCRAAHDREGADRPVDPARALGIPAAGHAQAVGQAGDDAVQRRG